MAGTRPPRISQVAYCCGHNYWRWRFLNRPFPTNVTCFCCNSNLAWRTTSGTSRAANLRYYHRRRADRAAQGLNSMGRPYRRGLNLPAELRASRNRRQSALRQQRRRERRAAIGLTSRGTPRKISTIGRPANPQEIAWQQFRATLTIPNTEILTPADRAEL